MKLCLLFVRPSHQWFVFDEYGNHRFELMDCEWLHKQIPNLDKTKRNWIDVPIVKFLGHQLHNTSEEIEFKQFFGGG